jgi:hypothetical protein
MKHRWAALGLVLALNALLVSTAEAQVAGQGGRGRGPGALGQNEPNPFNPETTIPFTVGMQGDPPVCADASKLHRVSIRIHNVLMQVVAIPILQGGGQSPGRPVSNLQLPCGGYIAFWDGRVAGTSREAASGVYVYTLEVDGRNAGVMRMMVAK